MLRCVCAVLCTACWPAVSWASPSRHALHACRAAVRHRAAVVSGVRAVLRHLPPEDARSLAAAKAFLLQFPLGMDLHRV